MSQFTSQLLEYSKLLTSHCSEEIERITFNVLEAVKSHVTSQIDEIETQLEKMNRQKSDSSFSVTQEKESIEMQLKSLDVTYGE
jgi:hypothetical protein